MKIKSILTIIFAAIVFKETHDSEFTGYVNSAEVKIPEE